jgi:TonB family protein
MPLLTVFHGNMPKILGFILLTLATMTAVSGQADFATVIAEKATLRKSPTVSAKVTSVAKKGEKFTVISAGSVWYLVGNPEHSGWIRKSAIRVTRSFGVGIGTGTGGGSANTDAKPDGIGSGNPSANSVSPDSLLKILSKPRPFYTAEARSQGVQGTVRLKVTFISSGAIGAITVITGLPYGLTEKAIEAARSIRFEPAKVNGVPRTTTRLMEFSFVIY